jgi:hypothetical protein
MTAWGRPVLPSVLTRTFPPELVDAVVRDTGREQQRHRLLPSRLVTYYVLAMTLFSNSGCEEVMRNLVEGLSWESGWAQAWTGPSNPPSLKPEPG